MNPSRIPAIGDALWSWPGEDVFAVVDGARDPEVHARVLSCGLRYACLYAGAIPDALAQVAPYVVRLRRGHYFTRELLEAGWGRGWGVFACAAAELETVRRHLRRFLRVQLEDGRRVVFRFYDPRVLRVYLPTCTAAELGTFLGPLSRYVLEDADPAHALSFSHDAGMFAMAKIVLDGAPQREPAGIAAAPA
jgi:hypothetical protein